jgi:hypothetical protein
MMSVKKPVALALLAVVAAAFSLSAQTSSLNPTVKVLARPQSPVPADCATDLSATAPAIEPEPAALEPANASVPPSNDLRASLRRLQVASEGDDYAAFKAALAEARRAVASHPPGGERNAANEALQVFTDIGRVWDYAMASPAGSFFDGTVQNGSLLSALKRYPDYGRTIAGETLVVGDKTLYPTRETRRFLARESGHRLSRLGVSTPARVAQGAQPEAWPHRATATPPAKTKPAQVTKAKPTPKTTEASAAPRPHKPAVKIAKAAPKPKPPHIESTPVPKPKPAAPPPVKIAATQTMPTPPPVVTTTTAAPPPVPTTTTAAVSTQPPPTTTTAAPATDTTTTTAITSSTDTTATAAPDTAATSTAPPAEKQNGNMNLLLAVVLILVGIGVLVILFRASD